MDPLSPLGYHISSEKAVSIIAFTRISLLLKYSKGKKKYSKESNYFHQGKKCNYMETTFCCQHPTHWQVQVACKKWAQWQHILEFPTSEWKDHLFIFNFLNFHFKWECKRGHLRKKAWLARFFLSSFVIKQN